MRYGKCKTGPFPLFSREAETASFCLFFSVFPRGHAEVRLERPVEIGEVFESAPGGDGQDGLVRSASAAAFRRYSFKKATKLCPVICRNQRIKWLALKEQTPAASATRSTSA